MAGEQYGGGQVGFIIIRGMSPRWRGAHVVGAGQEATGLLHITHITDFWFGKIFLVHLMFFSSFEQLSLLSVFG